ncbi:MAG: patatin-like phospholipase family protein [Acidobacteria bacterium]|nr:patatin-like phospholipase family protein [Acidobacteriota bacterium]MBV9186310.1 patatin-like phospholipase family protein [Acidobacteriota bacterium]
MLEAAYRDHLHDHLDEKVVLDRMQQANLTALCLSGGGIRSATFSLGVLQGLARRGLLSKVDYLSTVSGGGYIGSWLSSWMRRHDHGAEGVFDELAGASADPLKPEPEPIHHLREYSNYLAPRFAAFSPDLWTIAATYARNLLLVWLIILPPLLAVLMLPRAYEWWLLNPFEAQLPDYFTIHVSQVASWTNIGVGYFTTLDKSPGAWLKVAWLFLFLAMVALSLIRPVGEYVPGKEKSISEIRKARGQIWWFISFGFVATFALAMSWARYRPTEVKHTDATNLVFNRAWWLFLFANVLGSLCYLGRHYSALRVTDDPALNALARARKPLKLFKFLRILATRPVLLPKVLLEFAGTAAAAAVAASVLWLIARGPLGSDLSHPTAGAFGSSEAFAILGIPLLLLTLFIEATFLIGIVTIVSSDFEREWWARAAALVFLIGIGWIGVTSIALIGPALITQSPKVIAALGGISAIATVAVGYRDKSSPKAKKSTIVTIGLTPAAAIATLITLSALSLLNGRIVAPTPCQEASKQVRSDVVVRASMVAPAGYALHVEKKTAPSSAMDRILDFGQQTRCHIWVLRHTNWNWFWGSMGGAFLLSLLAGWLLDVNTYSMHSMYRNRLIRAYLGASRWLRRPDPFTGFDPQDNLQMYQLLPDYLWACSFADFDNFLLELPRSKLWSILPVRVRSRISEFVARPNDAREAERKDLYGVVFGTINQCMGGLDFETGQPAETTAATLHRNRAYLKKTFGSFLRQQPKRPPLHILNMALNLVAGDNLAWQERKAESFTVSPLHSGSAATDRLGFRDSAEYGGAKGISLGTAMAISGAAVSPNMGYHSSAPVTFMMTLFNARLGWWLGNPGPKGDATYRQKGPAFSLGPLLSEAFARTNDDARYIFLSDGGHFENLGLYEMVRRRCRSIIVCDAASDPKYWFGELGNAVRKIRIDFGIPIDFEAFCIGPDPETPEKRREAAYCALGTIRYSCVRIARDEVRDQDSDEDGRGDGHLIYIKPAVYSDCSVDVVNYSRAGKPFPQQTTVDQFFDETQFESYRELGSHIISKISRGQRGDLTAEQFYTQALKYLRKHGGKHAC